MIPLWNPAKSKSTARYPQSLRLPIIDVMRGLAAAAVVFFHGLGPFSPENLHPVLASLRGFTQQGWLGIHVFFALSGWCISERLAVAVRRRESSADFLKDRLLRIYPAYWAALGAAIVLRLIASPFNHTAWAASFPNSLLGWFGDLSLLHVALGQPIYLLVSWSLFFELCFYAVGAVALTIQRRRLFDPHWLLLIGALACAWPILDFNIGALRVLERWMDFYFGALAWQLVRRPPTMKKTMSAGLLFLACVLLFLSDKLEIGMITACATSLILVAFARVPVFGDLILPRPLVLLGAASYSLYLIHVPLLSPMTNLVARIFSPQSYAFLILWPFLISLTFIGGFAFYHFVEIPLEKRRKGALQAPK